MGGGWVSSHKVVVKVYVFTMNNQMASIGAIFTSTYNKAAKSMVKLISQSCGELQQLSACQGDMETFEGALSTSGYLISLRNKPQQKQPGQLSAQYLAELLVNVYSYHLMMKSVP